MKAGLTVWRWYGAAIGIMLWTGSVLATPAEELQKAADLYDQQAYQQAQDVLLAIDRDALDDAGRQRRDQLVERLRTAIAAATRARQDLEDARKAADVGQRDQAEKLFKAVLANEFSTAEQKKSAQQALTLIEKQRELEGQLAAQPAPVPAAASATRPAGSGASASPATRPAGAGAAPALRSEPVVIDAHSPTAVAASPTTPAAARSSTDQAGLAAARRERDRVISEEAIRAGDDALAAGQYETAEARYREALKHAPNDPRAVRGLEMVRQYRQVEGRPDLLDDSVERRRGRWARTETLYKENEREVRRLINERQYAEARTRLEIARQLLEAGKRDADPAERYAFLARQVDSLARLIDADEQAYREAQAAEQRVDVLLREQERREAVQREKDERIAQLVAQASELSRERQYGEAASVMREVLAIEPNNLFAQTMLQVIEDKAVIRDQELSRRRFLDQTQRVFQDTENSRVPEAGGDNPFVAYPSEDAWRRIVQREGYGAGLSVEGDENRRAREQLKTVIPVIEFGEGSGFGEVLDFIEAAARVDIEPNWNAMSAVGIDRTSNTGGLNLRDKTAEAALELLLKNVGGAEINLTYEIVNGIIIVSTREDLDRNTRTEIYRVGDLLRELPSAPPPTEDDDMLQNFSGGGMFGGGGGGFGGGFGGGGSFGGGSRGGGREELDFDKKADEEKLRQDLEEFITQNVAPGTWAPEGTPGTLKVWQDKMIVHHTEKVHREIAKILETFRDTSGEDQVAIEARFLTLRSNFLEEIGVDLDVVLNSGQAGYDRSSVVDPYTNNLLLLPRRFTQLGVTPQVAPVGGVPIPQTALLGSPYGNVALVPQGQPNSWWDRHSTPIPLVNNTLDLAGPRRTNVPGNLADDFQNSGPAFSLFGGFLDNVQVDFLLRATQMDSRGSSLDAPRLVLVDNEPGEIEIRTYVSYVRTPGAAGVGGTGTGGQAAGPIIPDIGVLPRGRKLWVYPQISSDRRYVRMYIQPTVTDVNLRTIPVQTNTTLAAFFQTPDYQVTTVRTQAYIPDGGTLLLGGLKLSAEEEIEAGVPVVSKIPILKRAFTNRSRTKDEYVLLILIKPSIIIRQEQERQNFPDLVTSDLEQKGS